MLRVILLIQFLFVSAHALCVKTDRANLRSGPSTKFEKTWEVFKYMPFKLLSKKSSWFFVEDLDGDKHWIHSGLATDNHNCAVVKTDRANLRTGPGTNYKRNPLIPEAKKYTAFRLLKIKNGWAQVLAENGEKYWIARRLLWVY